MVFGLLNLSAQDEPQPVKLVLNIDNVDHVTVEKFGEKIDGLQSGVNTLEISPWTSINILANDGFTLESVVNAAGEAQSISNQKSCSLFICDEDASFTVTTAGISTINFTIKVDDASLVSITDAQWSPVTVETGTNNVSLAATQLPLGITSTNWQPFYLVTLDGVEVPYNWGYVVTPVEGSVIDIQTKYPDCDFDVTFDYVNPSNSDFFCGVYVDEQPIADFASGFKAKAGSKIELYYNTGLWYNTQEDADYPLLINLNGEKFAWFGSGSSFILSKNTVVQVAEAYRKPAITVQLTVDNVEELIVYSGSESNKDIVTMQPGANTVTVGEDDACIVIETATDDIKIVGATINNEEVDINYYNHLDLRNLKQGDIITVTTNKPESGVSDIHDGAKADTITVYNLNGVRLVKDGTPDQVRALPTGIYIVNDKKVIVK